MAIVFRVVVVVSFTLLTLFAISFVMAVSIDRSHYVAVAHDAVDGGTLGHSTHLPFAPGTPFFVYNFSDCLTLSMLVLPPRGTTVERALSPLIPAVNAPDGNAPSGYPSSGQCVTLADLMQGQEIPAGYYHRYLHGPWVLMRALLALFSFYVATKLLLLTVCALLAAIAFFAGRAAWLGPPATQPRAFAFVAISAFVAVFYALPVYDRSISFAASDIVLIGFVLFFYLRPPSRLSEGAFASATALFGTLTAIFESFNGATPAGATVLLGVLALDAPQARGAVWRRAFIGMSCFLGALALSFAGKAAAVGIVWGWSEIIEAGGLLAHHAGNVAWDVAPDNAAKLEQFGVNVDAIKSTRTLTTVYALAKVLYFSPLLGLGSLILGVAITAVLPLFLVTMGIWRFRHANEHAARSRELLLFAAAAVMPVWYAVFPSHTIIHAFFMVRPMIWPVALLIGGAVLSATAARSQPSSVAAGHPR